jgi:hypothetical protein
MSGAISAGVVYASLVFGAGFLLGSIRVPFFVPWLGVRLAELIEMPFMFIIITKSAQYVVRLFALQDRVLTQLLTGFVALELLVGLEVFISIVVFGRTASQFFDRDPISGSVYFGMLCLCALMPYIASYTPKFGSQH